MADVSPKPHRGEGGPQRCAESHLGKELKAAGLDLLDPDGLNDEALHSAFMDHDRGARPDVRVLGSDGSSERPGAVHGSRIPALAYLIGE